MNDPRVTTVVSTAPPKLAFLAILTATAGSVIDGVAITVALPAMAEAFEVPTGQAALILTISQLVIVALLLPFAALGDRFGYRTVFLLSLCLALPATLAAIAAPDLGWLLVARAVQAVGFAGVMSVNFALIRSIYPPEKMGRGVATLATTVAVAGAAGPAIAGVILSVATWHWVVGMIVPLHLTAIVAGMRLLPASKPQRGRYPDGIGFILSAVMITALVLAPVAVTGGWPSTTVLMLLGVSVGAFLLLRRRLRNDPAPIFPFDLFRIPVFAGGIAASTAIFAAQFAAFVGIPFLFLQHLAFSPMVAGLLFSTWPAAVAVAAPFFGRIADRVSPRPLCIGSLILLGIGLAMMAMIPPEATPFDVSWRMALCGIGFAGFQTPNNLQLVTVTPRHRSGAGSGMMATARQLGRALGAAAAALIFSLPDSDALTVLWLAFVFACLAVVALLLQRSP